MNSFKLWIDYLLHLLFCINVAGTFWPSGRFRLLKRMSHAAWSWRGMAFAESQPAWCRARCKWHRKKQVWRWRPKFACYKSGSHGSWELNIEQWRFHLARFGQRIRLPTDSCGILWVSDDSRPCLQTSVHSSYFPSSRSWLWTILSSNYSVMRNVIFMHSLLVSGSET